MEDFRTRFRCSGVPMSVSNDTYVLSCAKNTESFLGNFLKVLVKVKQLYELDLYCY